MQLTSLLVGAGVGVAFAFAVGSASSPQDDPMEMDPEMMAQMMEKAQELAKPGAPHAFLQKFVGEWEGSMSVMGMPGAPASQKITEVFEGRFIRTEHTGNMMGMPFEGVGYTGFDNYKKKFNSVWMDSMGTVMHHSEGMLNQTGDTMTLWGTMDEWMTGEHDKPVKYVYHLKSADTLVFEIHDLAIIPGETKVMTGIFNRTK